MKPILFFTIFLISLLSVSACQDDDECNSFSDCQGDDLYEYTGKCINNQCEKVFKEDCYSRKRYCSGQYIKETRSFCGGDRCRARTQTVNKCQEGHDFCKGDEAWSQTITCEAGQCKTVEKLKEVCSDGKPFCSGDYIKKFDDYCGGGKCRGRTRTIGACKGQKTECQNDNLYDLKETCQDAKCVWEPTLKEQCTTKECNQYTSIFQGSCENNQCIQTEQQSNECDKDCDAQCETDEDCKEGSCIDCQCKTSEVPEFNSLAILAILAIGLIFYKRHEKLY